MMAKMLQILLTCTCLPGLCVLASSTFRVYHHVTEPKKYHYGAQQYCRRHHTDLVSIASMKEYEEIRSGLKEPLYWTGLWYDEAIARHWHWSLADPGSYAPSQTGYDNFYPNPKPNPFQLPKVCGVMAYLGVWIKTDCQENHFFICYDDHAARYIRMRKMLNWKDAQEYCRKHYTDLASARNQTENEAVAANLPQEHMQDWIGLFRDRWRWSDGSESSFRLWAPNTNFENPSGKYAAIGSSDGKMSTHGKLKLPFICYSDNPDVPRVTESPIIPTSGTDPLVSTAPSFVAPSIPKTTKQALRLKVTLGGATVDLNDPAVTEDILKQVKGKLKKGGVSGDLKLTWKKQADGKILKKTEL